MALLDSEVKRIRYELGYGLLNAGAYPYVSSVFAEFDSIIGQYITSGTTTTCSTSVTAAATPTPVALTLADATGFAQLARIVVDIDARQEIVTVESIAGSAVTVLLSLAHAGTYPVTVEGAESIVRDALGKLRDLDARIAGSAKRAGVRKVDEIEFFGGSEKSTAASLIELREYYRDELASALCVKNMRREKSGGGGAVASELY